MSSGSKRSYAHTACTARLAREASYSRASVLRVRLGRARPTLSCIAALTLALQRLTGQPVTPADLFAPEVLRGAWRKAGRVDDREREDVRLAFHHVRGVA